MIKLVTALFKAVWKVLSWFRAILLNLVLLVVIVLLIQGIASTPAPQIPDKTALVIAPSGILVDQSTYEPSIIDALGGGSPADFETVVGEISKAITIARDDDNITGIIIRLDYLQQGGMSKIEEIGQALNYFKESNKPVIAFADSFNQQQYLLASYADEIYVNPLGSVYMTGFGVYRNYYQEATEKLAIKFNVFRVGEYKDAIEPFIRNDMSIESREHIEAWLQQIWTRYTTTVETHRALEEGAINDYIAGLDIQLKSINGDAAELAKQKGLVDDVLSRNALKQLLIERFGDNGNAAEVNAISMQSYLRNPLLPQQKKHKDKIGLIVATGTILDGVQPEGQIGSDSLVELIRKAKEDKQLKALVLRIDSGGGSAFASEVIREELELTRESGLPIYVSMGSVAASGGYWISCAADEIWATPTTVTGSIGVWGLVPNISESLNKLGIYSDGVGTSNLADAYNIDRPMSEQAKRVIQSGVDNIYQRFISLVADCRDSTPESIHAIAQGRIWSGETALELGLVDSLGNLTDVIEAAAEEQNLNNYSVKKITRKLSSREKFIRSLLEESQILQANAVSDINNNILVEYLLSDLRKINQITKNDSKIFTQCFECVAP